MIMCWKIMVAVCCSCFWLMCQNILLMPVDAIVANEETTLWGVLDGKRSYDAVLSLAWEKMDQDVSPMERGEVWSYVWEYVLGDNVVLGDEHAEGLVKPLADSWHLFDYQRFVLLNGNVEGMVTIRLRYWDGQGREHCAIKRMTVVNNMDWTTREGIDMRKQLGVIRGLHYLQRRQNEAGGWQEGDGDWYWTATTACAIWAFGNHGFGVVNKKDNPFLPCVEQGVRYLANVCETWSQPTGNQIDVNGNGHAVRFGASWKYSNYVHPISVCGLIAAAMPEYEMTVHGEAPMGMDKTCSLQEIVEDGVDYILTQLSASGRDSWAYDYSDGSDGYDLSIAGWNYMALLAAGQWGVEIDRNMRLKFRSFLESVYYRSTNCFIYTPSTPGNHTESLDASGVIGLLLMSGNGLLDDELQCFDERYGIGEAVVEGTAQLFDWVRTAPGRNVGYSWWSVAKGLGLVGVKGVVFNGAEFDWRYGCLEAGRQMTGGWRKILEGQESDGKWTIDEDMYYYGLTRVDWRQTCMETAMMVLALSDDVLPQMKISSQTVDVVLQVPGKIYNGMVEKHLGEEQSDGSVLLEWTRNDMKDGEEWDLSFDYWLGEAENEGHEVVQIGGGVSWTSHTGQDIVIPLGELAVERTGSGYEMDVQTAERYEWGDELMIDVELILPKGDMSRIVQISDGTAETVVWESANVVTWLEVEFSGGLQAGIVNFSHLPDVRMRSWVTDTLQILSAQEAVFSEDTRGQRLKAIVKDSSMQGTVVVYGNEEPIYADVTLEHTETEKVYDVKQWEISPVAFGGTEALNLSFDSEGIPPGLYRCRGRIWKEGKTLAESECSVEISIQNAYPDWLKEQITEVVAELEFEDSVNQENNGDQENHENNGDVSGDGNAGEGGNAGDDGGDGRPLEPQPLYPIEPVEPVIPEVPERHGVFYLKRMNEREGLETEQIVPERDGRNSNSWQETEPYNEKQPWTIMYDRENENVTVPGAWANLDAMKGLGLRWGRIVTKSGPYPWEMDEKKPNNLKDSALKKQPMPVFCERCEKYWRLYGFIMKPEKGCCIYGMLFGEGWLLK